MPKQYEDIRDSYERAGKSPTVAKKLAAMTWNKLHPNDPNPWTHETKDMQKRVRKG